MSGVNLSRPPMALVCGLAGCALVLVLGMVVDSKAAIAGWLAAFVFWSAVPLGALALRMMVRLMPGAWGTDVAPIAETLMLLLPLAGLALLPVLIAVHALYPWSSQPPADGFRGVYLSVWFFSTRSVVFMTGAIVLSYLLLTRPAWLMPLSAGGLIAFVLCDNSIADDWLMSLDPSFHSSGFGLYVLSIQLMIALMVVIIARLMVDPSAARRLPGALIIVALLAWEYLSFMQYFIIWSENLPDPVAWFQHRGAGFWSPVEYIFSLLALVPTVLLFFRPIRLSRPWLLAIAAGLLLAKALEIVWLIFPSAQVSLPTAFAAAILAVFGLSMLSVAFLGRLGRFSAAVPAPKVAS
jgi:hypothetical protein